MMKSLGVILVAALGVIGLERAKLRATTAWLRSERRSPKTSSRRTCSPS
jgi:hypothetical protein